MSDAGIGKMKNSKCIFDPEGWYPRQAWLDGFAAISVEELWASL